MKKTTNKEIISRRSFFKRAAGSIIPIIAVASTPSILTSCEIDEEAYDLPTGCKNGCTGKCSGVCGAVCQTNCSGSCSNGCQGTCEKQCGGSSCRSLCKGSNKY